MAQVGFPRKFTSDPGVDTLTSIEGVVIIDREPPQIAIGQGSGTVCLVGEFENGPFAADVGPVEVLGADDLLRTFGDFGYAYEAVVANNPCARKRFADGAIVPEYWNGNGAIAVAQKSFRRLMIARVDTSVGSVAFLRLASLSGAADFSFDLEPGETLVYDVGAGDVTTTFAAAAATENSSAGTYPTTFAGGEWIDFAIDGGTTIRATFLLGDQTQTQAIARMNAAAGYIAFADETGDVTSITGLIRGTSGSVQIVAVSGVAVTTALGFSAGPGLFGTGDVANIDAVTIAEADAKVNGDEPTAHVDRDADGKVRIFTTEPSILIQDTSTATGFGFSFETLAEAASGVQGTIPAGTRLETSNDQTPFVTMQDVAAAADDPGPYAVKVRHATDDGTGLGFASGLLSVLSFPLAAGAFQVTNADPIAVALTEPAIDSAYVAAMDKTRGSSGLAKDINVIVSARQSNAVRNALRANAIFASANGCLGRTAAIRPPLGTLRATARSASAQPGVGAYRSDRIDYAYPGGRVRISGIATRGLAGGDGFSADGLIDVGSDTWLASVLSQLNPEENPGQQTDFMAGFLSIEAGNADVQALTMQDYIAFKAAGIVAPRVDGGTAFFQSGVNAVDPASVALRNISRRRMADFIEDSITEAIGPFIKKLASADRKALVVSVIDSFLATLRSRDVPQNQRIDSYSPIQNVTTANDASLGIFRLRIKVKLLGSLDVIVVDSAIGETVETTELAA